MHFLEKKKHIEVLFFVKQKIINKPKVFRFYFTTH